MSHAWVIAVCGMAIGFLSGLFGIAGSSVSAPLLRLLGVPRLLALASPLPVSLPTGIAGGLAYWRRGFVQPRTVFWTVLGGLPTVTLGAYLTTIVPGRVLMALSGGFLLVPAYIILCRATPAQAAANSLVCAAILSIPDTWVHWRLGHIDSHLVLLLSAGVLPAAYLGAHLGARLRPAHMRWLFGCFLVLFGVFFLLRTLYRAEVYRWMGPS